eukprot:COSAG06_NODE_3775_length_4919_cov_1.883817_2_plen_400_part_00
MEEGIPPQEPQPQPQPQPQLDLEPEPEPELGLVTDSANVSSLLAEAARAAPRWISSAEASAYMLCAAEFVQVVESRHHCRYCGWAVCGSCSAATAVLDRWLADDKPHDLQLSRSRRALRVCNSCFPHVPPLKVQIAEGMRVEVYSMTATGWVEADIISLLPTGAAVCAYMVDGEKRCKELPIDGSGCTELARPVGSALADREVARQIEERGQQSQIITLCDAAGISLEAIAQFIPVAGPALILVSRACCAVRVQSARDDRLTDLKGQLDLLAVQIGSVLKRSSPDDAAQLRPFWTRLAEHVDRVLRFTQEVDERCWIRSVAKSMGQDDDNRLRRMERGLDVCSNSEPMVDTRSIRSCLDDSASAAAASIGLPTAADAAAGAAAGAAAEAAAEAAANADS